jgi:voltage-dependent calcium channel alpha-2/delta-4
MDVIPYEIFPYTIDDNLTEFPCHKIPLNDLFRRRLEHCYTQHEDEDEIEACGGTSGLRVSTLLLSLATLKSFIKCF